MKHTQKPCEKMVGKERKNKFLYIFILVVFVGFCCKEVKGAKAPALFIFGDSLIDNGNNNYIPAIARANYPPYGIDFGHPTGRFCNGLIVVDYAAKYLGLEFPPPYLSLSSKTILILRGVNYASAAAGILEETGKNYASRVTLNGQIALFEKTLKLQLPLLIPNQRKLSTYIKNSLFIVNIGSNDYINNYLMPHLYTSSRIYSSESYAQLLMDTFDIQLKALYKLGARKILVTGLGPLGCIPSQLALNKSKNGRCIERVNNLVLTFNKYLVQLLNRLNSNLKDAFFVYEDVYSLFTDIVRNPSKYGFITSDQACCGNGEYGGAITCLPLQKPCCNRDKYVFWDAFHPTQAVNYIIATRCYGQNATDCHPISGSKLASL